MNWLQFEYHGKSGDLATNARFHRVSFHVRWKYRRANEKQSVDVKPQR